MSNSAFNATTLTVPDARPAPLGSVVDRLPFEIIKEIVKNISLSKTPSTDRLHQCPQYDMFDSNLTAVEEMPLKVTSLISRRWRAAALPLLFSHVVWRVDDRSLPHWERLADPIRAIPLLALLRSTDDLGLRMGRHVRSFTLIVDDRHLSPAPLEIIPAQDEAFAERYRPAAPPGDNGGESSRGRTMASPEALNAGERSGVFNMEDVHDNNWLWQQIFQVANPDRFTLIASPNSMGSLFSREIDERDYADFEGPLHLLSLSHQYDGRAAPQDWFVDPDSNPAERRRRQEAKPQDQPRATSCDLFTQRGWNSILLNEGSSKRVYSRFQFFNKHTPSILDALLGGDASWPNHETLIPPTVREMEYVAMYPLSLHLQLIIKFLPKLDRLSLKIWPTTGGSRVGGMDDDDDDGGGGAGETTTTIGDEPMPDVLDGDLNYENATIYSMIMQALINLSRHPRSHWMWLQEFQADYSVNRKNWERTLGYVRGAVAPTWDVAGEGMHFRRRDPARGPPPRADPFAPPAPPNNPNPVPHPSPFAVTPIAQTLSPALSQLAGLGGFGGGPF